MRDHEVEMESDEERLTRIRVQQHHNLISAYIGQPLVVAASENHPLHNGISA